MIATDFPCVRGEGFITYGGAGACMGQLVEGLLKKDVDVTVLTRKEEGEYSEKYNTKIIRTDYLKLPLMARDSKITHSYYASRKLRKLLRLEKFDILHSHNPPAALSAIRAGNRLQHILTMHGPWAGVRLNPLKRSIARFIEGYAVRNATHVTCDSKALVDEMIAEYSIPKEKLSYIPNAVDTEFFKPGDKDKAKDILDIKKEGKIILYTGRFLREKGIDVILDAIPAVVKKLPQTVFLLIGGGYDENIVGSWLKSNPRIKDNVRIIPYLSYGRMPYAYMASDVFIQPSRAEGLSRSILEAMACSVPVVASDVGGNPELVNEKTGVLVKTGDHQGTADAVLRVLENDPAGMGKYAREQIIEEYSVDGRINSFIKLYEKFSN